MTTTAAVSEKPNVLTKRQAIINDLRQKIPTSKRLAEDVRAALGELEEISDDRVVDFMDMLEFIEGVVHDTPDAGLRERLLAIRGVVATNGDVKLEQLRHMV